MNKHMNRLVGGIIFLIFLTFVSILVYDNYLYKQRDLKNPNYLSSYWDMGYYKINPETILASLENGDANVFMPMSEDPKDITEDVTDMTISWTQADLLKIASALGQFVWDDPMDLKNWNVYYIDFRGSCNAPIGLSSLEITYFKTRGMTYTTRLIEIEPYLGYVGWGTDETYPQPILQKWSSVDLLGAKITADDALRIASEDAKKRFPFKDNCGVLMGTPQNSDPKNWYLDFFGAPDSIVYAVNLETGNYTFQNLSK